MRALEELRILSALTAMQMAQGAQFRNVLAHTYGDSINQDVVYNTLQDLERYQQFLVEIRDYLDSIGVLDNWYPRCRERWTSLSGGFRACRFGLTLVEYSDQKNPGGTTFTVVGVPIYSRHPLMKILADRAKTTLRCSKPIIAKRQAMSTHDPTSLGRCPQSTGPISTADVLIEYETATEDPTTFEECRNCQAAVRPY